MFTGLITEIGVIKEIVRTGDSAKIIVICARTAAQAKNGDSVAINGCCMTVTEIRGEALVFDAMPETVDKTNLKKLIAGDQVNVEPSLRANAEIGGHFVTGHIDATGFVGKITPLTGAWEIEVSVPQSLMQTVVPKGSIALDGVSLTVIDAFETGCKVGIIPHTWRNTTISKWRPGAMVNIETDILGKYVLKAIKPRRSILEELIKTRSVDS